MRGHQAASELPGMDAPFQGNENPTLAKAFRRRQKTRHIRPKNKTPAPGPGFSQTSDTREDIISTR